MTDSATTTLFNIYNLRGTVSVGQNIPFVPYGEAPRTAAFVGVTFYMSEQEAQALAAALLAVVEDAPVIVMDVKVPYFPDPSTL